MRENRSFKRLVIFAIAGIAALFIFSAMSVSAAPTAVIDCDNDTDWDSWSSTISVDNSDWQEWDGSIKAVGSATDGTHARCDPTGTWDFSNDDYVVFWCKNSGAYDLNFTLVDNDQDIFTRQFRGSSTWRTYVIDMSSHPTTPDVVRGDGTFDWTQVNKMTIGKSSVDTTMWVDYITVGDANDFTQWHINRYDMLVRNVNQNKFLFNSGNKWTEGRDLAWGSIYSNSGDTIEAGPGNYTQHVIASNNDLTFKSIPFQGSAILKPTTSSTYSFEINSQGVTLDGLEIDGLNRRYAVEADNDDITVKNCIIKNTAPTGANGGGILARGHTGILIEDNHIDLNGITAATTLYDVFFYGADSSSIKNNTIIGSTDYGIGLENNNNEITITGNDINNNNVGIYAANTLNNIQIHQNIINANTLFGAQNTGTGAIDATCNFWGHPSGPYHATNPLAVGDSVSNNVIYNPWLTSPPPGGLCNGGICYNTVYVDDDYDSTTTGWNIDHFASIQDGINRVCDCGTVMVEAGTYVESIYTVGKSLKLIGNGNPIIQCPSSPNNVYVAESSKYYEYVVGLFGGTYTSGNDTVWGSDTITVEMKGFKIDANSHTPADRFSAILMRNVNKDHCDGKADIHHNKINNIDVNSKETFGILGYGDMHIRIRGNKIDQFGRGGIGIYDGYADIKNNHVIGPYNGGSATITWAPNGIQIGYGAEGKIWKNNVEECGYPGTSWSGTGIIVVDTSNVIVDDNYVHACEQGISVIDFPECLYGSSWAGACSDVDVTNNHIEFCEWGFSIDNEVSDVKVEGNKINNITYDGIDIWCYDSCVTPPTNIEIHYNSITSCGSDGLWVGPLVTQTVNATCNWWGSPNGPTNATLNHFNVGAQGVNVSGNAQWTPWLQSASSTTCWAPIYNLDTGEAFACIQEAIDDSDTDDGDIIECTDGTYTHGGMIQITKAVTIQGGSKPIIDGAGGKYAFEVLHDDVTLKNLKITNSNPTGPATHGGVLVRDYDNFLIRGCIIYDITSSADDYGLYFYGTDNSEAIWNHIRNIDDYGVGFANGNDNVLVHKCTIKNCGDVGVYAKNDPLSNMGVHNCSIFGHTNYGMQNLQTGYDFPACCNYWGDISGPYHPTKNPAGSGDTVSDYVLFEPWLDAKHWDDPSCIGPVYNYDQDKWYMTIQSAVDDANAGETIGVNGTFHENVVVDVNDLTIKPLDPNPPTFAGGWQGNFMNPPAIDGQGGRYAFEIVSDGVTLTGLWIINSAPTGPYNAGAVLARGYTDITIEKCIIDLGSAAAGVDLYGIFFYGTDESDILHNNIAGSDEYGIGLGNNNYDITIEYNDISGNLIGIYGHDDTLSNIQVHYNNITGNTNFGMKNDYSGYDIDATCNWWGHASGPSGGVNDPVTGEPADGSGDKVSANVHFDPWSGKVFADANGPYEDTDCVDNDYTINFDGSGSYAYCTYNGETITYSWDFGDGNTGTGMDPTHTYSSPGHYDVTLTVTGTVYGGTDTSTTTVDIYDVFADANGPYSTDVYSNYWVYFDASGTTGYDPANFVYDWDFGDGNTGTGMYPSHQYDHCVQHQYTVTLTVTETYSGCQDTDTTTVTVWNTPPQFGTPSPTDGATNQPVEYLTWAIPISDPDGDTFDWSISCSNGQSINANDDTDGTKSLYLSGLDYSTTYTVTVTATDNCGLPVATNTQTYTFTTAPSPCDVEVDDDYGYSTPDFGISKFVSVQHGVAHVGSGCTVTVHNGIYDGCDVEVETEDILITGTQSPPYNVYNDNAAVLKMPLIIMADDITIEYFVLKPDVNGAIQIEGDYLVHAQYNKFLKECEADAVGIHNKGTTTAIATYNWWGAFDGPSGLNAEGYGVEVIGDVLFNPWIGLNAHISKPMGNSYEVELGTPVSFDSDGSFAYGFDEEPLAMQYLWDFDDGAQSSDKTTAHLFDSVGDYRVSLRVDASDPQLHFNFMYDWDNITIHVVDADTPLTASADGENLGGYETTAGEPVQLNGDAWGGEGEYSYTWDFGDNKATSNQQNPTHTYSEEGTYTATLTVVSAGETAVDTAEVIVHKLEELTVSTSDRSVDPGQETTFLATIAGGTGPYTYEWDFGDGTTSTLSKPNHAYTNAGEYTLTLTVTDSNDKSTSDTATINVGEDETPAEPVEIKKVSGGFGLKATIDTAENNVVCSITVDGFVLLGGEVETTVDANSVETIKIPFTFALGKVDISVKAGTLEKDYTAFALGPFFLNVKEA